MSISDEMIQNLSEQDLQLFLSEFKGEFYLAWRI
jgi:hypothetical protein